MKKYLTLLKMADETIENLLISYETPPQSLRELDSKKQKLLECVLTGNSKIFLGKAYNEEQINKLNPAELDKLFNNYEATLSGQMVKSLGKSLIKMYSMGACAALGMQRQDALCDDLETDPFLNSALQRFTCELYYAYGSFLAPLSVGLITSRHYLNEKNLMPENVNKCRGGNEGGERSAEGHPEAKRSEREQKSQPNSSYNERPEESCSRKEGC